MKRLLLISLAVAMLFAVHVLDAADLQPKGKTSTFLKDALTSENYGSIIILFIMIQLFIVSLAYMAAKTFDNEQLRIFSKTEFMQAVYSLILFASIIGAIVIVENASSLAYEGLLKSTITTDSTTYAFMGSRVGYAYDEKSGRWYYVGKDSEGVYTLEQPSAVPDEKIDVSSLAGSAGIDRTQIEQPSEDEYKLFEIPSGSSVYQMVNDNGATHYYHCSVSGKSVTGCERVADRSPLNFIARANLGIVFEKLKSTLDFVAKQYSIRTAIDSMGGGITVRILEEVFSMQLYTSFSPHQVDIIPYDLMYTFIVKLMTSLKFQEMFLYIIDSGFGNILILSGIVLRSIWIFRKVGGLLLALGLAFALFLPAIYALGWYTIDYPFFSNAQFTNLEIDASVAATTSLGVEAALAGGALAIDSAFNPWNMLFNIPYGIPYVLSMITTAIEQQQSLASNDALFTQYEGAEVKYTGLIDAISRYAIISLIIPLMNIYITFALVKSLSPYFGGEAAIPGLERIL